MAGTFVGIANVQQFQLIGSNPMYGSQPMAAGKLYVYAANTTTPSSVFQDIGLSVPAPNPLTLDQTGRVPQFYVADGFYRLILTDATGVTSNGGFNLASVPSIGASTSGGSGSGVDPTTLFQTGWNMWLPIVGTQSGFVRANGRTIGSGSSGGTERANADCQNLFLWIWNNIANPSANAYQGVVGGIGVSAAADWAANKRIHLMDLRGSTPIGVDDMGNVAAGRLTSVSTSTPYTAASGLGLDSVSLAATHNGPHTHGAATGVDSPDHTHQIPIIAGANVAGGPNAGFSGTGSTETSGGANQRHSHAIASDGDGAAHLNMPPGVLGTWFTKL